ncbi:MAG TPA: HPr kinase/phosphatase C-terminal domain-containing protein [Alphaproteobacteria bacterium]|jgi:serine kinase of HPr protein (carbohydrate metabolism regulator)|nr:HPr kinase/phosphatase C-terminal domain-containing protein [Alphaproteobacteria bacterium]
MALIHGTCVAVEGKAVLLRGPSGSGKSDLALRLIAGGAVLVADDQVEVTAEEDGLTARAPAPIRGLIEVRGVGLVRMPWLAEARLMVVVDLTGRSAVPRLPDPAEAEIAGARLPHYRLCAAEASAPEKVRLLLRAQSEDILCI